MGSLYENIVELCKVHGTTPTKLCKDLGMSGSRMTELKKGRVKMLSASALEKISKYFGVTVDQLLGNEPERQDVLDQVDVAFYGEYKELDEQEKDVVREMVRQLRRRREEKEQK